MAVSCNECGSATVWEDDVGSAVCTSCGSLTDPSQSVLTTAHGSQDDVADSSLWDPSTGTTLKCLRGSNNWDLAGQGKESRNRKNMYIITEFIKSLALSFNVPGLSPRTIALFNQVKAIGNFRWGIKSRSVAGACLSIALRESNRSDLLKDIASVLKIPTVTLKHEFNSVTRLLKLTLSLVDPSVHITPLQSHLTSVLREHDSGLPASLMETLQPLCLRSVANTAVSLSQLFARLNPGHDILRLPTPPTACGIFMLALEAENRAVLNPLSDLAQILGARCHVVKGVVMARYKTIQDEIALWIDKIPWLDKYESKGGRAKVAKRLIVARGLKDVISFQEEIWQKTVQPVLELDLSDDENKDEEDASRSLDISRPRKRQKVSHVLAQATNFLLNPLGHAVPSSKFPASTLSGHTPGANELPLVTYILTTSTHTCHPPTRLQLLALDRGGVNEEQIPDEDLFAEGELEKMLRNEGEVQMLRERYGWNRGEDAKLKEADASCEKDKNPRKKRAKLSTISEEGMGVDRLDRAALIPRKKTRLNVEAMALFLAGKTDENGGLEEGAIDDMDATVMMHLANAVGSSEDEDEEFTVLGNVYRHENGTHPDEDYQLRLVPTQFIENSDEAVLEHWRASTPELGGTDSPYEEEYD